MSHIDFVFGPIGAGKSFTAKLLARKHNSIILSTDDWFRHLFFADMKPPITFAWSHERIKRCEGVIWNVAMQVLETRNSVVLDIGLATRIDRLAYLNLCKDSELSYRFHYVTAPKQLRYQRVQKRNEQASSGSGYLVSDEIFEYTDSLFEVPSEEELQLLQTSPYINDAT